MRSAQGAPTGGKRSVGVAVGVALLLALLVIGISYANAVGAVRVADNAKALHWANATSGTATALRLSLAQAFTFAELSRVGQATASDVSFAMDQVELTRGELAELEDSGGSTVSHPYLVHFARPVVEAVEALGKGDMATAEKILMSSVEPAYEALMASLAAEQADIQARIDANTAGAARATEVVRFLLVFAIPASAVVVYRYLARRAVRERRVVAEVELEAERAVGRAKDEFIAGLSHELRTPLTSIYGFAEVLAEDGSDPENARELATIIANESAELTRMVDDLLMAARMESTGIEINSVPTRVVDVVQSAASPFRKAGLDLEVSGDDVIVNTDAPRLRHVIINLLSNAARHGGEKVGVSFTSDEEWVDIEVWDNGPGIPEDDIDSMFDRFKHVGDESLLAGSLGMGLGVAYRLVTMLGGRLSYQRYVGRTYFTVRLARVRSEFGDAEDEQSVAEMIRSLTA